jgi:hypothetical protein
MELIHVAINIDMEDTTYRELISEDIKILSPEYLTLLWDIIIIKFVPVLDIDLFSDSF